MRTVLHIGMPKTGTTSLQDTLLTSRNALRNKGVLYPKPPGRFNNHRLLLARHVPFDELPRHMRSGVNEKQLLKLRDVFLRDLRKELHSSSNRTVVLSAESFFSKAKSQTLNGIKSDLMDLGLDDFLISCYLRRPDAFYLSMLQQKFKASHKILPLSAPRYRKKLEGFAEVYGRDKIQPRIFERSTLVDGDIVSDFVKSYLPDSKLVPDDLHRSPHANETLSADSMAILRRYRLDMHPGENDVFTKDSAGLHATLKKIDSSLGLGRPRLLEDVAEAINRTSKDLLWLRDEFGLEFAGMDYRSLGSEPREGNAKVEPRGLDEVLQLDLEIQTAILDKLLASVWAIGGIKRRRWIGSLRGTLTT